MDPIHKLILKLDTSSDKKAEIVIRSLVKKGTLAVPFLIQSAKDMESPRIRKWSLQALGAIGDVRAAGLLIKALTDERMTVKLHALKGLGRMKYKKAIRPIAKLLTDESGGIRVNSLYALIQIGDPSVSRSIIKSLSDKQWYVRQTASEACGIFRYKKAKAKLLKLSKVDSKKAVREAAKNALISLMG
jgi:HEAT repeat protein